MQSPSTPRLERSETVYSDTDLVAAITDCIHLGEQELLVTGVVEALRHVLKKMEMKLKKATPPLTSSFSTPAGPESTDEVSVLGYLTHFSYGLTPGEARYIIYRFLKANNWSIPKAVEDLTRAAEVRAKQTIDKMALFPCIIPMVGFDQRALCEQLRIPFVHNMASGKRYVDAEGRLRLEREQLDYYNVAYEDLYSNLFAAGPLNDSPRVNTDFEVTAAISSANLQHDESANGEKGSDTDDVAPAPSGGLWRSVLSLLPFTHPKSQENSPNVSTTQPPQSAMGNSSPTARRLSHFHSVLSMTSGSDRDNSGGDEDDDARERGADTQEMVDDVAFLNTAGAAVALSSNPDTMYADSLNFHGILQPIVAVITKHVPFAFHYWDREGHPAMYCRLGGLHSKKLMQELFALTPIDAEPRALALLFNAYLLLVLEQLVRYCNRRNRESNEIHDALMPPHKRTGSRRNSTTGTPAYTAALFRKRPLVGSCVIVVDCAGMKLRRYFYRPLLAMVRSIVHTNMGQSPELMHHVYITNCTGVVSTSYLMFRGVLSPATREKVTFCSKQNTARTLCECISSDLVPQELGGKCNCTGGCIPRTAGVADDTVSNSHARSHGDRQSNATTAFDEDAPSESVMRRFTQDGLVFHPLHCTVERIVLKARESRKLTFAMDAHSEIIWEFAVKREREVTFTAIFISAGDDGAMMSLVPRRRVRNDAGHYICPSIGTVVFEWSNKHSFFSRCRLSLKVYREERAVASL